MICCFFLLDLFIQFKEKYKQSKKYYEKSLFRNIHGAIIDQKYKAIHVHDELIFTQIVELF